MDDQYKQRIQTVLSQITISDIAPQLSQGANQCPACHKKGKFYVYSTGMKCYSSSCELHKYRDLIGFYGYLNHLSYHEALVTLEKSKGLSNLDYDQRHQLLNQVLTIYNHYLFNVEGQEALRYLNDRGFSNEYLQLSRIGYAPVSNVLKLHGIDKRDLMKQQLCSITGNDYFKNRIIFPVYSRHKKLVHLIGRYVGNVPLDKDGDELYPRYKNSRSVQHKSTDFLLFENNLSVYENKRGLAILTEGCTDSFTLNQYGLPVLGMLGIEKLANHYYKLKNLKQIYCVFDNDRFDIDHPVYPNQYKSWSRILPELVDLQFCLPHIDFYIWMVPSSFGKDLNDYFLNTSGSNKSKADYIFNESISLTDFMISEYKYDFSKHITLMRLIKLKGGDLKALEAVIPPDYSPTDYLMKVV